MLHCGHIDQLISRLPYLIALHNSGKQFSAVSTLKKAKSSNLRHLTVT